MKRHLLFSVLMLTILFTTLAMSTVRAENTIPLRSIEQAVMEAPNGNVFFIYTNASRTQDPQGAYDAVTGGILYGMCNAEQNQGFDTNKVWVQQGEGGNLPGMFKPSNKTVVLLGGPISNIVVRYYEWYKSITPVYYWYSSKDNYQYFISDPSITGESKLQMYGMNSSRVSTTHADLFVIESFRDDQQNTVFIIYGLTWKGTWAGGIYFKNYIYPKILQDPSSYTKCYFIGIWDDSHHQNTDESGYMDGIPQSNEIWEWKPTQSIMGVALPQNRTQSS